jgi:hypothetical protein
MIRHLRGELEERLGGERPAAHGLRQVARADVFEYERRIPFDGRELEWPRGTGGFQSTEDFVLMVESFDTAQLRSPGTVLFDDDICTVCTARAKTEKRVSA